MRELDDARYKAIGARIRDVRLQRNMSQAELAEKAFISVPHMRLKTERPNCGSPLLYI